MPPKAKKRAKRHTSTAPTELVSQVPPLPVEIIRMIFENVAFASRKERLVLCLVSKTCQSWISPIIYHTVVLSNLSTCRKFRRTVNTFSHRETHTSFLATHTKCLLIPFSCIPGVMLDAILVACSKLTMLSCSASLLEDDMSQYENLRSLSRLYMPNLLHHAKTLPSHLTHISCDFLLDSECWRSLFASCPDLTHLALTNQRSPQNYYYLSIPALSHLLPVLPKKVYRLIIIVYLNPDSLFGGSLHRGIQQQMTGLGTDKRIVWMSIGERDVLGNPFAPTFEQETLAERDMVAGATGWSYLEHKQDDIWALAERIAGCNWL